jgi:arginase family enzyme
MRPLSHSLHIDLDGAWPKDSAGAQASLDCREWGPRLRYSARKSEVEAFYAFVREQPATFTLFGSGDFHHLTALWLRRIAGPFTLISFDNHPDWDTRPPRWGCGTWINRALELPMLRSAAIWGCGNFELNWPGCLFVSRTALRARRLSVWPWTERLKPSGRKRWAGMQQDNWREMFRTFVREHSREDIYVTVDLDCLEKNETVTNWEHGLFKLEDIVWALGEIREHAKVIGGDVCGAYSQPHYARWSQWIAATFDHPRCNAVTGAAPRERNLRALGPIWKALTCE